MRKGGGERADGRTCEGQQLVADEDGGLILGLVQSVLPPFAEERLHGGRTVGGSGGVRATCRGACRGLCGRRSQRALNWCEASRGLGIRRERTSLL